MFTKFSFLWQRFFNSPTCAVPGSTNETPISRLPPAQINYWELKYLPPALAYSRSPDVNPPTMVMEDLARTYRAVDRLRGLAHALLRQSFLQKLYRARRAISEDAAGLWGNVLTRLITGRRLSWHCCSTCECPTVSHTRVPILSLYQGLGVGQLAFSVILRHASSHRPVSHASSPRRGGPSQTNGCSHLALDPCSRTAIADN